MQIISPEDSVHAKKKAYMTDKVIPLPFHNRRLSRQERKLMQVSDEFDRVILKHLEDDDIDLKALVGVMAHRLGTLLQKIDRKEELWGVCEKVIKAQAKV